MGMGKGKGKGEGVACLAVRSSKCVLTRIRERSRRPIDFDDSDGCAALFVPVDVSRATRGVVLLHNLTFGALLAHPVSCSARWTYLRLGLVVAEEALGVLPAVFCLCWVFGIRVPLAVAASSPRCACRFAVEIFRNVNPNFRNKVRPRTARIASPFRVFFVDKLGPRTAASLCFRRVAVEVITILYSMARQIILHRPAIFGVSWDIPSVPIAIALREMINYFTSNVLFAFVYA